LALPGGGKNGGAKAVESAEWANYGYIWKTRLFISLERAYSGRNKPFFCFGNISCSFATFTWRFLKTIVFSSGSIQDIKSRISIYRRAERLIERARQERTHSAYIALSQYDEALGLVDNEEWRLERNVLFNEHQREQTVQRHIHNAKTCMRRNKYDDALIEYRQAIKLAPSNNYIQDQMDQIYQFRQREVEKYLARGEKFADSGQYEESLVWYRNALEISDEESINSINSLITIAEEKEGRLARIHTLMIQARHAYDERLYVQAASIITRVREMDAGYSEAIALEKKNNKKIERYQNAERALEKARDAVKNEMYDDSIQFAKEATMLDPTLQEAQQILHESIYRQVNILINKGQMYLDEISSKTDEALLTMGQARRIVVDKKQKEEIAHVVDRTKVIIRQNEVIQGKLMEAEILLQRGLIDDAFQITKELSDNQPSSSVVAMHRKVVEKRAQRIQTEELAQLQRKEASAWQYILAFSFFTAVVWVILQLFGVF